MTSFQGLFTPRPPNRPIPPEPVAALFLPPKNPSPTPQWAVLDLDDDTPLAGGAVCNEAVCESCQ